MRPDDLYEFTRGVVADVFPEEVLLFEEAGRALVEDLFRYGSVPSGNGAEGRIEFFETTGPGNTVETVKFLTATFGLVKATRDREEEERKVGDEWTRRMVREGIRQEIAERISAEYGPELCLRLFRN